MALLTHMAALHWFQGSNANALWQTSARLPNAHALLAASTPWVTKLLVGVHAFDFSLISSLEKVVLDGFFPTAVIEAVVMQAEASASALHSSWTSSVAASFQNRSVTAP
jgi:hypothetical protein